ncbi:uncharacterized protein LOC126851741 isoform X2 [Cataglyphis hispanica]|uniref:uncharacterized protein LOC126851741 isoform X2 n=1 Tax=Cataglyphis hispanica TaxID=1086592 RepID=UPI00217FE3AE|nr:uncharacterized protein LOC126851741 isoform X2 [Cataglyphis hispanica]
MDTLDTEICGFLNVKLMGNRFIAQKVRKKTLILSKVWKRLWCSTKKLGPDLGVQVQFDTRLICGSASVRQGERGSCIIIPPNAIVYRIRSKTKQYAFAISSAKDRKPLLSLSTNSETETQHWMANIRQLLKPRRYYCMEKFYSVSMVDNAHSKALDLIGLYGDSIANDTGIFIKDVYTGETIKSFEWKEFSQFHLMTAGRPEDVKRICVMHTTKESCCGIGELYIFCLDANKLLQDLVTQGRGPKQKSLRFDKEDLETVHLYKINNPLSQLQNNTFHIRNINCLRPSTSTKIIENIYESEPNLIYSEEADSYNHRISNTSIASGIYEEIVDNICSSKQQTSISNMYEEANKIPCNMQIKPPALPPRQGQQLCIEEDRINMGQYFYAKMFNLETKLETAEECIQKITFTDNNYVPMSSQLRDPNIFESDDMEHSKENDYVIMR